MSLIDLDNPQREVKINLHMDGHAFEHGIPVHLLLQGFETSQTIFDRSYLGLIDRARFTAEERQRFYLLTQGVRHSSLASWMDLVLTGVQISIPTLGALGPAGIWEYAKQAYDLLKFAYGSVKNGNLPTYQNNSDGTLNVNNGTQINVYNGTVITIARASQRSYVDMAKNVADGTINSFSLSEKDSNEVIRIDSDEAEFFNIPSSIDHQPLELSCEIFDFNKFDDVGKLRVFEDQELPSKDYRFSVIGNQADATYIEAMLRREVTVICLREMIVNPLAEEKIVRLQVIEVKP